MNFKDFALATCRRCAVNFILISFVFVTLVEVVFSQEGVPKTNTPPVEFRLPTESKELLSIQAASDWIVSQIHAGEFVSSDLNRKSLPINVIAWHDPTLHPDSQNILAAYLITDTLWCAHALKPTYPTESKLLFKSLTDLSAASNGLQDVLFAPLERILHQPIDTDIVHGESIGRILKRDTGWIDVRVFHYRENPEFAQGHPKLFAEVAAYQSLFEFWRGNFVEAKARLRSVFRTADQVSQSDPVCWDNDRKLLIDKGNYDSWKNERDCEQFPVKLGAILYALRLTGLDQEYKAQCDAISARLWDAAHPATSLATNSVAGSVAHFFLVRKDGTILRVPGATGEATAIAILASTIKPILVAQ